MKRIVLLLLAMVGALTMQAKDYTYLTFEMTDGAKASIAVDNLTLQISGTTLTAGGKQFTLTNLSKMYFSTTDESTVTSIDTLSEETLEEATEIYDLQGHKVPKSQMRKGVYIVKAKDKTYKIAVK